MAEASVAQDWLRALALTRPIEHNPLRTFPTVVTELAERFGSVPALVAEGVAVSVDAGIWATIPGLVATVNMTFDRAACSRRC